MSTWRMQPELKHQRAQEAQRGVVARMMALLSHDVTSEMTPDDLEVLSLQMKLASVNLMVSARELREVEEERRFLAREQQREALRYEKEATA